MEFNPWNIELIVQLAPIKAFNSSEALQIIVVFLTLSQKLHDRGKICQIAGAI